MGPCDTCGEPYESCPVSDPDAHWTTDANGNHEGLCCEDCGHHAVYDCGAVVNAPLDEATIAALAAKLRSGDIPVRRVAVRPSVTPSSPWDAHVAMWPSTARKAGEKRAREDADRRAWEDHMRKWMSSAVAWARGGGLMDYYPPAPWWVGERWMWANGDAFNDRDALNMALVRSYGCQCTLPLLGSTMNGITPTTPRCRTCNAEAPDERS